MFSCALTLDGRGREERLEGLVCGMGPVAAGGGSRLGGVFVVYEFDVDLESTGVSLEVQEEIHGQIRLKLGQGMGATRAC